MAQGGDKYDIGILRMNGDPANVLRVAQAHVLPAFAAVQRAIDAVPPTDAVASVGLAGADPNDVRVARSHGHGAQILGRLAVKDRLPGFAIVVGLPQSPRGGRDILN